MLREGGNAWIAMQHMRKERRRCRCQTYLCGVHLELADDFDGNLGSMAVSFPGTVYVAEGTVAHFLQQGPPFQAGIFWQLPLAFPLFRNDSLDD